MSSYEEYSDSEPDSSDQDEYEIPLCFCGKDAKRRISGTDKNWLRPFFNCSKRKFDKQCGFFVWEDELYSDESGDESSYICDECLEKERGIDEIESATDDGKASWDREKLEELKQLETTESDPDQNKKRIKDANEAVDMLLFDKVNDELLNQDGDQSGDEAESVCEMCLKLKRRIDENKVCWDREKLELLTKLETAESEVRQIKRETKHANEADDKPLCEKLSNSDDEAVESKLRQISKKTKLANEVDCMPPFDKLFNQRSRLLNLNWITLERKPSLLMRPMMCRRLKCYLTQRRRLLYLNWFRLERKPSWPTRLMMCRHLTSYLTQKVKRSRSKLLTCVHV